MSSASLTAALVAILSQSAGAAPPAVSDPVFTPPAAETAGALALPAASPWSRRTAADCDGCGIDCGGLAARGDGAVRWRFGVPSWLPEVHGDTVVRGRTAPVNVTTRSLFEGIDDLDFVVAGRVEAEAGRWGLIVDGGYLKLSGSDTLAGGRVNVAAGFEQAIVDAAVTYDVQEQLFGEGVPPGFVTELLAGGRYWLVGSDNVSVTGPLGNTLSTSGDRQWVDPIVGGRIAAPLTDDLTLRLRGDVGGFGAASQFSWNVEALGEYRCSDRCGLQLGYRVLDVDYRRGSGRDEFVYDVQYRGPIAVLVFDF